MADLTPFATKEELAAFWRDLTDAEATRADVLLPLASNLLRQRAEEIGVDLDAKKAASQAFSSTLQWVVMEAVKRALQTPTDSKPVDTFSQTAGPYSENYKFSNPSGDLWFRKAELRSLGLYGQQTMSAIKTSIKDIYS